MSDGPRSAAEAAFAARASAKAAEAAAWATLAAEEWAAEAAALWAAAAARATRQDEADDGGPTDADLRGEVDHGG